ncbi:MAG: cation:proton antiporter [Spirochaetes bacterium]|nr:cation:proton antiporter [Spirochaetota bacterium]
MEKYHLGILLLFGIAISGGIITSIFFSKMKMPQVIGYIIAGLLIGQSGFNLIPAEVVKSLTPFNYFALGIIGFLVGSELKFEDIKKYGKQFSMILLFEGIFAFVLVTAAITGIMFFITRDISISVACGVVFGAIASATDPASTVNVLWEYRAAGILTTTIIAIVALDDALAMFLYGVGTSLSQILTGSGANITAELFKVFSELSISSGLGVLIGILIVYITRYIKNNDSLFVFTFGLILVHIGLCVMTNLDIILSSMFAGIVVINMVPERSHDILKQIKALSTPIYIVFFVLVGARMNIMGMPIWLWYIIASYVLLRSAGKYFGSYFGAKLSKADPAVVKYTGLSIFAQGGVAIGLSIMASQHLSGIVITAGMNLGDIIIFGVTSTTLIVQLAGPLMVKLAITKSGERGRNVTLEDILAKWKIKDKIEPKYIKIDQGTPVRKIMQLFTETNHSFLAVVNSKNKFMGVVKFQEIKSLITDQTIWDLFIAADLIRSFKTVIHPSQSTDEVINLMEQIHSDQLPVIDPETYELVGVADKFYIIHSARNEMFNR